MLKLYYVPKTRSLRPRWLLEELGVPYELHRLDPAKHEQKSDEYKKIHPLGHVPALVDGAVTMFESAAICLYLADKYPEKKLAPAPGSPERAAYYQWIIFGMSEMERTLLDYFQHTSPRTPAERHVPAIAEDARARFAELCGLLESALADRPYLLGEHFSAADLLITSLLSWAGMGGLVKGHSRLEQYAARNKDRPAFRRAVQD